MGPGNDLRPYKPAVRVEYIGIYVFKRIPSQIVIAVSGRSGQMDVAQPVFLHGMEHLVLIILGDSVHPGKFFLTLLLGSFGHFYHFIGNTVIFSYEVFRFFIKHQMSPNHIIFFSLSSFIIVASAFSALVSVISIHVPSVCLLNHVSCLLAKCLVYFFMSSTAFSRLISP